MMLSKKRLVDTRFFLFENLKCFRAMRPSGKSISRHDGEAYSKSLRLIQGQKGLAEDCRGSDWRRDAKSRTTNISLEFEPRNFRISKFGAKLTSRRLTERAHDVDKKKYVLFQTPRSAERPEERYQAGK